MGMFVTVASSSFPSGSLQEPRVVMPWSAVLAILMS
jgi:hypothetical protein